MGNAGRSAAVVLVAGLWAAVAGAEAPIAVSPGHSTHLAQVGSRCPTFSWGGVAGAASYQLVVYRLEDDSGEEAEPVARATVPGSATGWTPAIDQCLIRGARYFWAVRAVGEKGDSEWSTPALFEILAPTAEQFEEALQVVQTYLAFQARGVTERASVAEAEAAEADAEPVAGAPSTRAIGTTQLSVDGGVVAESFTGDGSTLTNLVPGNLASGTAAIDISGNATTASTASSLICSSCVSVGELDFAPAVGGQTCPADQCVTGLDASGLLICGVCNPLVCGDGVVQPGEECDDANAIDTDACLSDCDNATCGDGFVWDGIEECDDGNNSDGDGCSAACLVETGGLMSLGRADFDDGLGNCGLDGWAIASGASCYSATTTCPMLSETQDCCDNFACPIDSGSLIGTLAFQADQDTCVNGAEQWRLQRAFDTTGLSDTRVCFDYADQGATTNDRLQIEVDDGSSQTTLLCDDSGPRQAVDEAWYHQCLDLPSWADNNANVTLRFFLHSEDANDRLYLDNIDVQGWSGGCAADYPTVLSDDFDSCVLTDWTVSGTPACGSGFQCDSTSNLKADNSSWSIERSVDASTLDDQVVLCFDLGDNTAGTGESVLLEFNVGSGFTAAWSLAGDMGPNNSCGTVCVNLSSIDPSVNNNPNLGVRLSLASNAASDTVAIDNVQLSGARNCTTP